MTLLIAKQGFIAMQPEEVLALLEGQSEKERRVLATRAALRSLINLAPASGRTFEHLAVPAFKALVVSYLRYNGRALDETWPDPGVQISFAAYAETPRSLDSGRLPEAARANFAAVATMNSSIAKVAAAAVTHAAEADGLATDSSPFPTLAEKASNSLLWAEFLKDFNDPSFERPLWSEGAFVEAKARRDAFMNRLTEHKLWIWFFNLYQAFESGSPLPLDLCEEVASIPLGTWNIGLTDVAPEIERLQTAYISEKLPLAEELAFDNDEQAFVIKPKEPERPALLSASLSRVQDALNDCLEDPSNGLNDSAREVKVLRRMLQKYGNNPQRIEMDLTSVHGSIVRQIAVGELPSSEENQALLEAAQQGAQGIRATDTEIAENRRLLGEQQFKELSGEQKEALATAQPMLEAISAGELAEDFATDIPFLLEEHLRIPSAPPAGAAERCPILARQDELHRTLGRSARIAVLLRSSSELIQKIHASTPYKGVGILVTIVGLLQLFSAFF